MASVFDAAAYILEKQGEMTVMKLQKLVYYAQAWSLVWDQRPLFRNRIEAWANGPVCPDLYEWHRGRFSVVPGTCPGEPKQLDPDAVETIDVVLGYYGEKHPRWLSDLTHMEAPWRDARKGIPDGERSNCEITHAAMAEYYGSLDSIGDSFNGEKGS